MKLSTLHRRRRLEPAPATPGGPTAGDGLGTTAGLPAKPRHRKFFGISEGDAFAELKQYIDRLFRRD